MFSLADDLAQEAFLRAYKNIRSFRGEAKFSTWLYRIAYNCFREDARKRKELVGINEEQWQAEQDPQHGRPGFKTRSYACAELTAVARAIGSFALLPERFVA